LALPDMLGVLAFCELGAAATLCVLGAVATFSAASGCVDADAGAAVVSGGETYARSAAVPEEDGEVSAALVVVAAEGAVATDVAGMSGDDDVGFTGSTWSGFSGEEAGASFAWASFALILSAMFSSIALECVFFSVTPTSGRMSRMTPFFTSKERASSLILIFAIIRASLSGHPGYWAVAVLSEPRGVPAMQIAPPEPLSLPSFSREIRPSHGNKFHRLFHSILSPRGVFVVRTSFFGIS
jgi:hypothetical protein